MLKHIWPIRTGATLLDVWSIAHICAFVVVGFNVEATLSFHIGLTCTLIAGLLVGIGWEVLETLLEHLDKQRNVPEHRRFIRHPERWLNRWVGDPIIDMVGFVLGLYLAQGQ